MPYLIISRKLEQAFKLVRKLDSGEEEIIEITYAGRHGSEIRIGISAPLSYKIKRTEDNGHGGKEKSTEKS